MRRLESLPGVRSVSLSHSTLIGGGGNWQMLHIGGYVPKSGEEVGAAVNWIGQNFFETLGIPVVLGRSVTEGDTESAPKVVVVNERFVRQFLGAGNPIGRRIGLGDKGGQDVEIVGVVADTKYFDLREDAPETIYLPWQQYPNGAMNFEVRTLQNPMELTAAVRQVAQNMDRNLALYDVRSQVEQISKTLSQERLFARLTSFFGALAMLLACVGIYGVMGFAVTRRTREIGIRMALGASRSEIANMVLRETLALVGIGMILGIIVALDRKSTRLNSSHGYISYAVFCLKKKNNILMDASKAKSLGARITTFAKIRPQALVPDAHALPQPSTGESMGQSAETMAKEHHVYRGRVGAEAKTSRYRRGTYRT